MMHFPESVERRSRYFDAGRTALILLTALILVKLLFLTWFALDTRFIMDELTLMSQDPSLFYTQVDPHKTTLHNHFYQLAHSLGESSVDIMRIARLQTLVLVILILVCVYGVARRLTNTPGEALFAVAVLLSISTFMERSFRVRSEPLTVLFALLALLCLTYVRERRWWPWIGSGIFLGLSFLVTQKAIYFAAALGLAALLAKKDEGWRQRLLQTTVMGLSWGLPILIYAVVFGGGEFYRILSMVFLSPLEVAFHGADAYHNLRRYVLQTLSRNVLAYGLLFTGLGLALAQVRNRSWSVQVAAIASLLLTVLVYGHDQPWPYVFLMAMPFLALWGSETLRWLGGDPQRQRALLLALTVMLSISLARNVLYLDHDNFTQRRVMHQAEQLLGPNDTYADGIGMIPSRRMAGPQWYWDRITLTTILKAVREDDFTALDAVIADQPKVWIYSYRTEALMPYLRPIFESSYVRVHPNILLAGTTLSPDAATRFYALWPGRYTLYEPGGNPVDRPFTIDGTTVRGSVELTAKSYVITVDAASDEAGTEPLFLLPAGLDLPGPLPSRQAPLDLFAGVYD